jgi:hypothetical protein
LDLQELCIGVRSESERLMSGVDCEVCRVWASPSEYRRCNLGCSGAIGMRYRSGLTSCSLCLPFMWLMKWPLVLNVVAWWLQALKGHCHSLDRGFRREDGGVAAISDISSVKGSSGSGECWRARFAALGAVLLAPCEVLDGSGGGGVHMPLMTSNSCRCTVYLT